jgi:plasmid stability protein
VRTTLTLDEDVAVALERRRREHGHSLKEEVNDLLRVGLMHVDAQVAEQPRFRVRPFDAGGLLIDIDDVSAALDVAEGPWRN